MQSDAGVVVVTHENTHLVLHVADVRSAASRVRAGQPVHTLEGNVLAFSEDPFTGTTKASYNAWAGPVLSWEFNSAEPVRVRAVHQPASRSRR